jgi:hypothetical protein
MHYEISLSGRFKQPARQTSQEATRRRWHLLISSKHPGYVSSQQDLLGLVANHLQSTSPQHCFSNPNCGFAAGATQAKELCGSRQFQTQRAT